MLSYKNWKKLKDWANYIVNGGEYLTEGAILVFLSELGIVGAAAEALAWLFFKCLRWGVNTIIDMIPHEAEIGIAAYRGDMDKLKYMAIKDGSQISIKDLSSGAKSLPLVPLKPALKDRVEEGKVEDKTPSDGTATVITAMPVPPFGTGFKPNLAAKYAHYEDILKADLRSYHMDRLKKTAPYLWNGSPVAGAPPIGFIDAQKIYKRTEPVGEIYPNYR